MAEARSRGYFGIGVEGVSKSANVGALLRTAHAFGAAFCFIVGAGCDARAGRLADTADTPEHVPLWRFPDIGSLRLPQHCVLVGVELLDDATDLPSFRHPMNAAYVLGPERSGLSPAMLAALPARRAHSDPILRSIWRWLVRWCCTIVCCSTVASPSVPVGSEGKAAAHPVPRGHGAPRFRRNIPEWVECKPVPDPSPLVAPSPRRISCRMRRIVTVLCLSLAIPLSRRRQPKRPVAGSRCAGAKELGKFDDWIAATHQESGQTVCYAFIRAKHSVPALPGRGEVILTVTERPSGRDAVAISAGFPFRKDAAVTVQVDTTGLDFYTAQSNAFARDGKAAVAAFLQGWAGAVALAGSARRPDDR